VICGGEVALGQVSLRVLRFSLSGSFHPGSILIYHLEKNNGSVGGRGLDTQTHPIEESQYDPLSNGGVMQSRDGELFLTRFLSIAQKGLQIGEDREACSLV
jgi:hypothetical protein